MSRTALVAWVISCVDLRAVHKMRKAQPGNADNGVQEQFLPLIEAKLATAPHVPLRVWFE